MIVRLDTAVRATRLTGVLTVCAVLLAACQIPPPGPYRSFNDPAVRALMFSDLPEYFADLALARRIAQGCARIGFDTALENNMNARRNEQSRGSIMAPRFAKQVAEATAERTAAFIKTYGRAPGEGDMCAPAEAELEARTPLSALLVPDQAQ